MDVFISWSGPRSKAVAEALKGWLPKLVNAVKPWLSSEDIDKGARWSNDVATKLELAKAGIICLTPANLHSDWILFEAGALSRTVSDTFVCTLLVGLDPSEVKGPLAQFQATRAVKDDMLRLIRTLNGELGDSALSESHLEEVFDVWWPKLELQLNNLPDEETEKIPKRTDRDLLEELLGYARNQNRTANLTLSDDDKKQILIHRGWKAFRSIHGNKGGGAGAVLRGSDLELSLNPSDWKYKYKIIVPGTATPDEMEAAIASQVRDTDRANMPSPAPPVTVPTST